MGKHVPIIPQNIPRISVQNTKNIRKHPEKSPKYLESIPKTFENHCKNISKISQYPNHPQNIPKAFPKRLKNTPLLDVPPEIWGHFHERLRDFRTASLFGLVNRHARLQPKG